MARRCGQGSTMEHEPKSVCIVTANIGGFETPKRPVVQMAEGVEIIDYKLVTDAELPPRKSLSPRMRAKLPKMFAWEMFPGYSAYIWMDASMWMHQPDGVQWFLDQLGWDADIAVFRHPSRVSVREEAEYLTRAMAEGPDSAYLRARYSDEDLAGQLRALAAEREENALFAGTAFCYRPTRYIRRAMREWWYHVSRFHCNDQLSFSFALWKGGCDVRAIDENIFHASRLSRRRGYDPEVGREGR